MMRAQSEREFDEYECTAIEAIMHANASNATKRISANDLFKRPTNEVKADKSRIERLKENTRNANAWLARLRSTSGKE